MTWLEDVEAALEKVEWDGDVPHLPGERGTLAFIVTAARRLVSLGEGEKVEWCEEHGAGLDRQRENRCATSMRGYYGDCRMVSRLLVDPVRLEGED
jgi:hypothetical protein